MGFTSAPGTQLTKVEVIFYQGNHSGDKQPFFTVVQLVRLHADGAQQYIHPLFLGECLAAGFQLADIHMGHLDGSELTDADRIAVFLILFVVLVFQLHNAPYAAAKQTVILLGVLVIDGDITQAQIGERSIELVLPDIQVHSDHINNGMAAVAAELGENLLCFIRADEVVRQNALDVLNALFDNLVLVGAAVLSQQELQNINRHIGAFFDFLGQVLPHDFAVEGLTQLGLDDLTCAFICMFHKSSVSALA